MKKFIFVVIAAVAILMGGGMNSVFAGTFSFDPMPQVPLFREPVADPYSFSSHLHILKALDENQRPNKVYAIIVEHDKGNSSSDRAFYDFLPYDDTPLETKNSTYINMKTAISLGLLRFSYDPEGWFPALDFELNLAGYINTIFNMFGKNDTLDFDGSFFVGASLRVAKCVSLRFGMHHFSGHYGDELLEKFYSYNEVNAEETYNGGSLFNYAKTHSSADSSKEYYLNGLVEYVRDNSWIAGISADLPWGFRVYGEAELPMNPSWLRPFVHCPADYDNPVEGDSNHSTLIDRIGGDSSDGEHIPQTQLDEDQALKRASNGSYKAWRIHTGLEWRLDVGFGAVFVAGDVQFHQDGQTLHKIAGYSKSNPWEFEVTVGGGLELGNFLADGRTVRIEAYYHNGRVPATQWFYQRMSSVTVGFGVN